MQTAGYGELQCDAALSGKEINAQETIVANARSDEARRTRLARAPAVHCCTLPGAVGREDGLRCIAEPARAQRRVRSGWFWGIEDQQRARHLRRGPGEQVELVDGIKRVDVAQRGVVAKAIVAGSAAPLANASCESETSYALPLGCPVFELRTPA